MTKNDWTILFVRMLGLYLIGTHLATFATGTSALILALSKGGSPAPFLLQAPIVSFLVLMIGIFLVTKAAAINAALQKMDKR